MSYKLLLPVLLITSSQLITHQAIAEEAKVYAKEAKAQTELVHGRYESRMNKKNKANTEEVVDKAETIKKHKRKPSKQGIRTTRIKL